MFLTHCHRFLWKAVVFWMTIIQSKGFNNNCQPGAIFHSASPGCVYGSVITIIGGQRFVISIRI